MLYFGLVAPPSKRHYKAMMQTVFKIISALFGLAALYVIWMDLSTTRQTSILFGQFWFEHHAMSLQVSEAIISRYIDPCGLFVSLDCEPFLWHPIIAGLLGWPAALVFILLLLIFAGLARLANRRSSRRTSKRTLHRDGAA